MEVLHYPETTFEKLPVTIFQEAAEAAASVAYEIATLIRRKQQRGEQVVLGSATGSSPIGVYKELIRLHREDQQRRQRADSAPLTVSDWGNNL